MHTAMMIDVVVYLNESWSTLLFRWRRCAGGKIQTDGGQDDEMMRLLLLLLLRSESITDS